METLTLERQLSALLSAGRAQQAGSTRLEEQGGRGTRKAGDLARRAGTEERWPKRSRCRTPAFARVARPSPTRVVRMTFAFLRST